MSIENQKKYMQNIKVQNILKIYRAVNQEIHI